MFLRNLNTLNENKVVVLDISDVLPLHAVFGGVNYILRLLLAAPRIVAAGSITSITMITRALKKTVKSAADKTGMDLATSQSKTKHSFSAFSPFEESSLNSTEHLVYLLCLLLVILALIVFTILVCWVITTKYNGFLAVLNKQNLLSKIVVTYFEKIKNLSSSYIFFFVVFFYIDLVFCSYLLLNYF